MNDNKIYDNKMAHVLYIFLFFELSKFLLLI